MVTPCNATTLWNRPNTTLLVKSFSICLGAAPLVCWCTSIISGSSSSCWASSFSLFPCIPFYISNTTCQHITNIWPPLIKNSQLKWKSYQLQWFRILDSIKLYSFVICVQILSYKLYSTNLFEKRWISSHTMRATHKEEMLILHGCSI